LDTLKKEEGRLMNGVSDMERKDTVGRTTGERRYPSYNTTQHNTTPSYNNQFETVFGLFSIRSERECESSEIEEATTQVVCLCTNLVSH